MVYIYEHVLMEFFLQYLRKHLLNEVTVLALRWNYT
jgi:hypothetical protein